MDHDTITATGAVERYLLSEMPPEERDAFEQHFFECDECAAEVSSGTAFIANARAVFADDNQPKAARAIAPAAGRRWFPAFRPAWGYALAGVALVFGLFQTVQRLPLSGVAARQVGPILLAPGEVRGEGEAFAYRPGDTLVLRLDIERKDALGPHSFELRDEAAAAPIAKANVELTAEDARQGREIRFRDRRIQPGRRYVIVLRKMDAADPGEEVDRYYLKLESR